MLISVCIPHYNRSKYLLKVLESISNQDHDEIETIISDDCSTDDSSKVIPEYIAALAGRCKVRFRYIRQSKNLGYDGNLRASMAAAQGEFLFVLGNDDALAEKNTLSQLVAILKKLGYPDVSFTKFHSYDNPKEVGRSVQKTVVIGSGPDVAVRVFRSFSFVGGIIIKNSVFREYDTSAYDGSVYVQMYLGARIISAGGTVASISTSMVAKDVKIAGEVVNSYLDVLATNNQQFRRQTGGLDQVGRVVCDAILPYVPVASRQRYIRLIYGQLLLFTYPYWLLNYRSHSVYRAAVNMALGCFPPNLVKDRKLTLYSHAYLLAHYFVSTSAGLVMPLKALEKMQGWVLKILRSK